MLISIIVFNLVRTEAVVSVVLILCHFYVDTWSRHSTKTRHQSHDAGSRCMSQLCNVHKDDDSTIVQKLRLHTQNRQYSQCIVTSSTELRRKATCIKNLVKFGLVVFESYKWTDTGIFITVCCDPSNRSKVTTTVGYEAYQPIAVSKSGSHYWRLVIWLLWAWIKVFKIHKFNKR